MPIYHIRLRSWRWLVFTLLYLPCSLLVGICVAITVDDLSLAGSIAAGAAVLVWAWSVYLCMKQANCSVQATIHPDRLTLHFRRRFFYQHARTVDVRFADIAMYKDVAGKENDTVILKLKNGQKYDIDPAYPALKAITDYSALHFRRDLMAAFKAYGPPAGVIMMVNKSGNGIADALELAADAADLFT